MWSVHQSVACCTDRICVMQVFSLLTAGLGLAAFALILALVEQVNFQLVSQHRITLHQYVVSSTQLLALSAEESWATSGSRCQSSAARCGWLPQVVLEIIEDQVKRGSRIYEREHVRAGSARCPDVLHVDNERPHRWPLGSEIRVFAFAWPSR